MNSLMKHGIIAGSLMGLVNILAYQFTAVNDCGVREVSFVYTVVSTAIGFIMTYLGAKDYRDNEQNGYLNFGKGFKSAFTVTFYLSITITIVMAIHYLVLAPDWIPKSKDAFYAMLLCTNPAANEQISLMDPYITKVLSLIDSLAIAMSLVRNLFWGLIVSIIIGAILQRVNPQEISL